jgi:hypothetical protein
MAEPYSGIGIIGCSDASCDATIKAGKWSMIRAQELGWFFAKDGGRWCPEHTPAWVEEWRAKQAERRARADG